MTLKEARILFTSYIALLILHMEAEGYQPALAEGMDRRTEKDPTTDHMTDSLHELGLAQDIDLYKDGIYLTQTEDHHIFGLFWEGLHNYCQWGGRFSKKDGNHYSFADPSLVGNRK